MQNFICPAPLRPQDAVSVIAPAGAVTAALFHEGLQFLEAAGLRPTWDPELLNRTRYFAGGKARRQAELLQAVHDPYTKAVWAARGGSGTAHLLAGLSREDILLHKKWLIGFSDLTGLHARWQQAGMLSLHGANVTTLPKWSGSARAELFNLLGLDLNPDPSLPLAHAADHTHDRAGLLQHFMGTCSGVPKGAALGPYRGRLWGGNLTVLASLVGTGALPQKDCLGGPSIVLLEEIGEAPYRLDRCWHQLAASGLLKDVVAVAVGQLTHCEAKEVDYTALEMLTQAITSTGLPWVAGFPLGHEANARAVRLGGLATLDVQTATLSVQA